VEKERGSDDRKSYHPSQLSEPPPPTTRARILIAPPNGSGRDSFTVSDSES